MYTHTHTQKGLYIGTMRVYIWHLVAIRYHMRSK